MIMAFGREYFCSILFYVIPGSFSDQGGVKNAAYVKAGVPVIPQKWPNVGTRSKNRTGQKTIKLVFSKSPKMYCEGFQYMLQAFVTRAQHQNPETVRFLQTACHSESGSEPRTGIYTFPVSEHRERRRV